MPHCRRCDDSFDTWLSYKRRKSLSIMHNICDECGEDFSRLYELNEHWVRSADHTICQSCSHETVTKKALYEHLIEDHHYCSPCRELFPSDFWLKYHYRFSDMHHYCETCDRHFLSRNNLRNHLDSSIHKPKTHHCPFRGCNNSFVSMSALILHLESGTCRSGMNRARVDQIVGRLDRHNIITDPSRLITGGGSSTITTFSANERAWNGYMYECYLCSDTFRTLAGLNLHLASPRHQEKIYVCPGVTCRTRFSTLSALWQHVESEKCGITRFEGVRKAMDGIIGGVKLLSF